MPDEYSAVWISYSSISDFLKCPRLYFLKNIYKTPDTRHKISIITPSLALGQVVHDVLDSVSSIPQKQRFERPLTERLDELWPQVSGKRGGFTSQDNENRYKTRARKMLNTIQKYPGPLSGLSVKIKNELPHYWLSEKEGIILCGKIDWIEYNEKTDGVGIIDFKTGSQEVEENSLQLPIYFLLATHCQTRRVEKISYWYIERDTTPKEMPMPNIKDAFEMIYKYAKLIKARRQMNSFVCPMGKGGCVWCEPYERIIRGEGEFVGVSKRKEDMYILPSLGENNRDSVIL